MTIIHMETEQVAGVVRNLFYLLGDLHEEATALRSARLRLAIGWISPKAAVFQDDLRDWLDDYQDRIDALQALIAKVNVEVEEWEQAASDFEGGQENSNLATLYKLAGLAGFAGSYLGAAEKLIKIGDLISTDTYKSFGRGLNWLIGNQRGGWVGRMDELGSSLNSAEMKALGKTLGSAPFSIAFGAVGNIEEEGLGKAVVSEGIEFLLDKAIYAVPVVGQVYLAYNLALSLGSVTAGILDVAGYDQTAVWLQNNIETLDLTERASDWIYEQGEYYLSNPSSLLPDPEATSNIFLRYGSGMIESGVEV